MKLESESIILSIDLIDSIKNNDTVKAIDTVNAISDFWNKYGSSMALHTIPFYNLYEQYPNEAMDYVLTHLDLNIPNLQSTRIFKYLNDVKNTMNKDQIQELLSNEIKTRTLYPLLDEDFFNEFLFRLALINGSFDVLPDLKENIISSQKEEEDNG